VFCSAWLIFVGSGRVVRGCSGRSRYASWVLVCQAPMRVASAAHARTTSTAVVAGIGSLKLSRTMLEPGWACVPTAAAGDRRPSAMSRTRSRAEPRKLA
jgi:hypothetical protein